MNPGSDPIVLLCAVPRECERLREALVACEAFEIGHKSAHRGWLDGVPVVVFAAGMGKVNAAHGATALLERHPARGVVSFGIAGAYAGTGVSIAEVVVASEVAYGDEGVETPSGWLTPEAMEIPLVVRGDTRFFDRFVPDPERVEIAHSALRAAGIAARAGGIATVSACSGTTALGRRLAHRTGALCEAMEGAAIAHICTIYDVPFLEVRAISNDVEDRDMGRWRIAEAAAAVQAAVRIVAASWKSPR